MIRRKFIVILLILTPFVFSCSNSDNQIDLSGIWKIALDSLDKGIEEEWFNKIFTDEITLPGTLCDGGYGNPCTLEPSMDKEIFLNLKRKFDYVGIAWYSRKITVPCDWKNKHITLNLERVIWNSSVWIDGKKLDEENESLVSPHEFNLTGLLNKGEHSLTIRIDNRKKHDISIRNMAHAYTNETQTMWNGIIGKIFLKASDKIYVENIRIEPEIDSLRIKIELDIAGNVENEEGDIIFKVKEKNGQILPEKKTKLTGNKIKFYYPLENPKLWDEFNPDLYELEVELRTKNFQDIRKETFGIRKIHSKNSLLHINNRRIFLRGTLECCIFPLKGYPPADKVSWRKIFDTAKEYGLNHLRFHSWCPPKAAFEAADEAGIYLQIELPLWVLTVGEDKKTVNFLFKEAERIIKTYGNHPSFCFFSLGNELQGDFYVLDSLILSLKDKDSRRLYTTTTFTFEKNHGIWPETHDDFWVSQWTKKGWIRGQGVFDSYPANFVNDYSAAIDSVKVPVITHEIGQYSVYPNLKEIDKYTGNLIPLNFISVKNDLTKKGRLNEADAYLNASGKLAAILYKEEIERALKTPNLSGFQLLDLHDFPGQGTALVGLLDAFWESKGLISPEKFRNFCSSVVPLVRFDKAVYSNTETFEAKVEIANFSNSELHGIVLLWKLAGYDGRTIAEGKFSKTNIITGNNFQAGTISVNLSSIEKAEKLKLNILLENTQHSNSWEIWVYPQNIDIHEEKILYTRNFDEAKSALENGKNVLLNPDKKAINGLEGKFVQVFWSPVHFPDQAGTMGILCDPNHPALKDFPTESHSNWQWRDICKNSTTLILDSLQNITPIVRMIDNFYKNRNLGLIFEAKIGTGKLLFCSSDLNIDNHVSRQLRFSLNRYMASADFDPQQSITFKELEAAFKH